MHDKRSPEQALIQHGYIRSFHECKKQMESEIKGLIFIKLRNDSIHINQSNETITWSSGVLFRALNIRFSGGKTRSSFWLCSVNFLCMSDM